MNEVVFFFDVLRAFLEVVVGQHRLDAGKRETGGRPEVRIGKVSQVDCDERFFSLF